MTISSINNAIYLNSLIFKSKIRFVVDDEIKKQIINIENNKIIREVPPNYTSQIITKLYG